MPSDDRSRIDSVQKDWKEPLLCVACEQWFSAEYETFLSSVLFHRRKNHRVLYENHASVTVQGESDRMVLAMLSILWRALIAKDEMFERVAMPDYMEESLRSWLHCGKIDKSWPKLLTVRIQKIIGHDGRDVPILLNPFLRDFGNQFEYVVICASYLLGFKVPPNINLLYNRTGNLRPGHNSIRINKVAISDVPELETAIKQLLSMKVPEEVQRKINESYMRESKNRRKKT